MVHGERIHALDFVRGFALLLGVAFHASLSFYPGDQVWITMDTMRSEPVAWLGFTLHIFRMATFFLLAGLFGRMILERRGTGHFVLSRMKRIAGPLVILWLPMIMVMTVIVVWAVTKQYGIPADQLPEPPPPSVETFPLTHLWFLYLLLIFYAAMLIIRIPVVVVDRSGGLRDGFAGLVVSLLRMEVLALALGAAVAAALLTKAGWVEWFGVPTPDTGLIPNTPALVTYGLAFVVGWCLHRRQEWMQVLRFRFPLHLALAGALTFGCLYLLQGTPSVAPSLDGREKLLFASAYGLAVWYWTFGIIGAALVFFQRENRVIRYLADSSYWIYLIHLPIVMALQVLMTGWSWPAEAKYLFILGVSVPVMLLSYQVLVRHTFVGTLLNGPRKGS